MYDRGLATQLHQLTATLFDLEETRMFVGLADIMNGHICLPCGIIIWSSALAMRVPSSFMGMIPMRACLILMTKP